MVDDAQAVEHGNGSAASKKGKKALFLFS